MKFSINQKEDTSQLEINAQFLMDDFNQMVIVESLSKAKDEIVKRCVEYMVEKHLQTLVEKVNMESLVNAVYLGTAREISKQITKG